VPPLALGLLNCQGDGNNPPLWDANFPPLI
jgi:hypothetical protein